ncbi:hypothetical protein [Cupriavidus necator]
MTVGNFIGFVLGVLVTLLLTYLKSHWAKRGENAAIIRDTPEITRRTEEAKEPFTERAEGVKFRNSIRLAALDKRLAAHQEAYRRWRGLIGALHTPEIDKHVYECQQWFDSNCLYLEEPARAAFYSAYHAAFSHSQRPSASSMERGDYIAVHMANINRVTEAGAIIEKCVALPALSEKQHEDIVKAGKEAELEV